MEERALGLVGLGIFAGGGVANEKLESGGSLSRMYCTSFLRPHALSLRDACLAQSLFEADPCLYASSIDDQRPSVASERLY